MLFIGVPGLSCPKTCGISVLLPGIELASPALKGGFLTTGSPGKSPQTYSRRAPSSYCQPTPILWRILWCPFCVPKCLIATHDSAQLAFFPFSEKAQLCSLMKNKWLFTSPFPLSKLLWDHWSILSWTYICFGLSSSSNKFLCWWASELNHNESWIWEHS